MGRHSWTCHPRLDLPPLGEGTRIGPCPGSLSYSSLTAALEGQVPASTPPGPGERSLVPVPRPLGAGRPARPPLPRVPFVSATRMLARLPTLVSMFPSRKAGATEAGVGRAVTGQKKVVGDPGRRQGTRTRGRCVLRSVLGPSRDRCRPGACTCWAGSGLPAHACLFGKRSLCNRPQPHPAHRTHLRPHTPGEGSTLHTL